MNTLHLITSLVYNLHEHTDADDVAASDNAAPHADGHFAKESGGDVTFDVGSTAIQGTGGSIAPGTSITLQFINTVQ